MKKVFKYSIPKKDSFSIIMPSQHDILSVQTQHGEIFIWVAVDINTKEKEIFFRLAGTGAELGSAIEKGDYKFIGTFQLFDGDFVGHLFEILI